jgi:2-keto-4-pentenoate hydratase/2-oxohepta-3-ene-1,7-dioic acid hydratase in catechol pathway
VALGRATPRWLVPGDTIRIQMTGLGTMTTPVRQERTAP